MGKLTVQGEPAVSGSLSEPSNKTNSIGKLTVKSKKNTYNEATAPTPFIDRLCIVASPPNEEVASQAKEAHFVATSDQTIFKSVNPAKGFKRAFKIALPSVVSPTHWPHYQYTFGEQGITKLRVDLVPIDLGWEGMMDLHSVLVTLLPDGWQFFIKYGAVTRLDVALDFPDVTLDDFLILPQQCLTVTRRSNHGKLQTVELGKPKGNQTCIYDRFQKRVAKGQGSQYSKCVRVERRLKAKPFPLSVLKDLKNPFEGLNLIATPLPQPKCEKQEWRWDQFKYSVGAIGLESALAIVPEKRRASYRKHLTQLTTPWWDAAASWSKWDNCLKAVPVANMSSFV